MPPTIHSMSEESRRAWVTAAMLSASDRVVMPPEGTRALGGTMLIETRSPELLDAEIRAVVE